MDGPLNAAVVERLESEMAVRGLPGLAVAVRQHDEEVFALGLGRLDAAGQRRVTADTPFGLASLTKFVTASLIMLLDEQGALSLDDPLTAYFPALGHDAADPIRLRHLLTHSAGLPGLPSRHLARDLESDGDGRAGTANPLAGTATDRRAVVPEAGLTLPSELVSLIRRSGIEPLAPPGSLLSYSNEGYCLLGGVIEQVTGSTYPRFAHERLLGPLRMTRSTIGRQGLPPEEELALPRIREGEGFRTGRFWQAPLFYPAGGLIGSARDTARLIGSLDDRSAILSRESRSRMMQPHLSVASRPGDRTGYGYGLEWHRVDTGPTLVWHSGQRPGVSSFMAWVPQQRLAISVLCNLADVPVATIGHSLVGDWLGRADIAWPPECGRDEKHPVTPDQAFAGRYGSEEVGMLVVEAGSTGWTLRAHPGVSSRPLHFVWSDGGVVGGQTFRFLRKTPGETPWALALDLRILRRYPAGDHSMSGSRG